ncbi:hypothetical protein PC129_g20661 [Phytophthora cactorum]|uniref:Uncharacterized protein n=1 Tax=Phytophthora cactorum TaxID=29920 RepID=A0A8T1AL11_9STRA|nr:hypothetical protein Pcac1_g10342 [Phytophthora cactorum]KAG2828917.1 hypothetical protein PC113_g21370 [Phytophthora cactorum]KAG2884996.1 hypothetical protein PC115_g21137 [Phytophthora cactorum]KAG2972213.1 hypothetical protein PC119_g23230 [Phytophthora cactorum]KAG3129836.1 hypothetical protein C6341_g23991 [Phytophthora cactorum]
MTDNQESGQNLKWPTSPPSLPRLPVFPPLPPLPPPDASKSTEFTRKAPPVQPASVTRSESRPRRFGTKITNLLSAGDGSSAAHKADYKSPPASVALAAAQRYYHHYQHLSQPGKKSCVVEKLREESYEMKSENVTKESSTALPEDTENNKDLWLSAKSPQLSLLQECIPKKTPMQSGRTIWSVTPDELTELVKEMATMKKESAEPVKKLSYAEASKRNLPGFTESRASQEVKAMEDDRPLRTFKTYYGLPIIPSYESSRRDIHHAATLEEKEDPLEGRTSLTTENKSSFVLNHSQISGLSATTPTFYPRQTTETNDLIQLLKASLASKKIAPHMDWWPGDWKCRNCGNHVLIPKAYNLLFYEKLIAHFSRRRTFRTGIRVSGAELGNWKTLASFSRQLLLILQPELRTTTRTCFRFVRLSLSYLCVRSES